MGRKLPRFLTPLEVEAMLQASKGNPRDNLLMKCMFYLGLRNSEAQKLDIEDIDLINRVGPIPGHYLDKAHTRKWWAKEQFVPILADRQSHADWVKSGSKTIIDRAKERVQDILSTHKPTPLPEDQVKALDEIVAEATAYYKQKGML